MAQIVLGETASVTTPASGYGTLFLNGVGTAEQLKVTDNTGVTIQIMDNRNTVTATNKTFTTPTINGAALSGTLSGTPTFSGACIFSAVPQFSTTTDITAGTYTTGSTYCSGGLSVTKGVQAKQIVGALQTLAVNTSLALDCSAGCNVLIGSAGAPGALTGATTITFTNPKIGDTTRIMFLQGATSYNVIFTIAGYTFYQNGKTAGVGSGNPVLLAADMTLSQYYTAQVTWLSATTAMVSLLKS